MQKTWAATASAIKALQLRYNFRMKTATFPPLRITPQLRQATEQVLQEGETLSRLAESAIEAEVHRRQARADFIARGLASRNRARQTGKYVSASNVLDRLSGMLEQARHTRG
jgi:predicted transcriptional regulator